MGVRTHAWLQLGFCAVGTLFLCLLLWVPRFNTEVGRATHSLWATAQEVGTLVQDAPHPAKLLNCAGTSSLYATGQAPAGFGASGLPTAQDALSALPGMCANDSVLP